MRVAVIHEQYRAGGGMERYLFDLLRGLSGRAAVVDVFAHRIDAGLPVPAGQRVHRVGPRFVPGRLRPLAFARAARAAVREAEFDLVLSLTGAGLGGVLVCGGTCRGHLAAVGRRPRWRHRLRIAQEARAMARARHVVAHSRRLAAELRDWYGVTADRLTVLYPPVDADRFRPVSVAERRAFRERLGIRPDRTVVLFPAAGDRRKGHDELMAAFARLPPQEFELITAGHRLPTDRPDVRHLGYATDMRALYGTADLTVLPSRYEPFGLVVTESVQCGTPVVVSPAVGAAEVLGPGDGLIVHSLRPADLADGIAAAAHARLRPAPDFVGRAGLDLAGHVTRLRQLAASSSRR